MFERQTEVITGSNDLVDRSVESQRAKPISEQFLASFFEDN